MELHININEQVTVTLTKEGADAINRYNKQCIEECLKIHPRCDTDFLKTDYTEGDTIKDSMWHLFSLLGDYLRGETSAPFKNNEIFIEKY